MTWTKDVVWSFFTQFQSGPPPSSPPPSSPPPAVRRLVVSRSWVPGRVGAWTCRTRSTANGTQLQLWDCTSQRNQRWTYTVQ